MRRSWTSRLIENSSSASATSPSSVEDSCAPNETSPIQSDNEGSGFKGAAARTAEGSSVRGIHRWGSLLACGVASAIAQALPASARENPRPPEDGRFLSMLRTMRRRATRPLDWDIGLGLRTTTHFTSPNPVATHGRHRLLREIRRAMPRGPPEGSRRPSLISRGTLRDDAGPRAKLELGA